MRKYHWFVAECLKFKRISGWIAKKHCCLFAHFTGESCCWRDDKVGAISFQPFFHCVPIIPVQNRTKMARWHFFAIDRIGFGWAQRTVDKMRADLMPKKIKINREATCVCARVRIIQAGENRSEPFRDTGSSSLFESSEAKELLLQGGEYSTSYSNATAMVLSMPLPAFLLSLSRAFRASFSIKYYSKFCDKRYIRHMCGT